ncbi:MAG: cysteine--tRNA ligase [Alphaproteobacteria bacterium]|nr:MAG: cysteine--tRNA ligase [Alphaproteobacteria bacterium]
MELQFYNTATRKKERFEPLDPQNVRVYTCGPTVYDYAHIGNGRTFSSFDLLFRLLRHVYGEAHVTYVRNITDIDDKIIDRAGERGVGIRDVTDVTTEGFKEDMKGFGLLEPTHEPRATDYLDGMIDMMQKLVDLGHAYEAEGHLLFDVKSDPSYGKFANRSLDDLIAGARVEVAPYKKDPVDFVLWKPSTGNQPGWPSPWGRGRPGWHTECSVMSEQLLGETFDIHAGGVDLIFPHHQNEIAQSTCVHHGAPMANFWLHAGFLEVEGEKMSKSLGNFYTVHDLLKQWPGEALRLAMFTSHYRQFMNFSEHGIRDAKILLDRWYRLTEPAGEVTKADVSEAVVEALADDLNTPKALAELHEIAGKVAKGEERPEVLKASAGLFGLLAQSAEEWFAFRPEGVEVDEARIAELIAARNAARKAKDFAKADAVRDELAAMGIAIKDGPEGTTWELMP